MNYSKFFLHTLFFFSFILPLSLQVHSQDRDSSLFHEKYRPQFHFTPKVNWINDPNGLLYYKDVYHLFYQYNPEGNVWGHMSWGHATSTDLVHWAHLPVAIPEEKDYMIFSGSAVADVSNTTGFAKAKNETPLVAIYTAHKEGNQSQHLAYSLDEGKTWQQYAGNPVLDIHKKDFRDPSVFWYAPKKQWIMSIVLPDEHKVQFYGSYNLKKWTHLSDFGPAGDTSGIWECPDLFHVPIEGSLRKKWVLMLSLSPKMQYFVGEFDGKTFHNETSGDTILRPDYGLDYYAAISYNNLPSDEKPVTIGWANNWQYANDIPTKPWKGMMSLPRNVSLKKTGNEWILMQKPIGALDSLRGEMYASDSLNVSSSKGLQMHSQQAELQFTINVNDSSVSGVILAYSDNRGFIIGYNAANKKLFIDRSKAGADGFNENFKKITRSEKIVQPVNGKIKLHIYFDHSLIEVFANDGEVAMTAQLFPKEVNDGIVFFNEGGATSFTDLKMWQMKSIWK